MSFSQEERSFYTSKCESKVHSLNFYDTQHAFSGLSNKDLRTEIFLFKILGKKSIVRIGKWLLGTAKLLRTPIAWILKPTVYDHFVGGKDLDDCLPVLNRLRDREVTALLDYSAEEGTSERETMSTYKENMIAIKFAVEHRNQLSHAVIKASGLVDVALLIKQRETPESITDSEKDQIDLFHSRFIALCREAYDQDIKLVIDAEHYAYQDIIDQFTEEAIQLFNQHKAIIYTTLQMYRHDRLEYLYYLEEFSRNKGLYIGVKLVRGAYLEQERMRSIEKGYHDPIYASKTLTDEAYDKAIAFVIDHLDNFELFAGTHNEISIRKLAQLIDEKKIERNDNRIYFSQLFGMGDLFTFNLVRYGYNASKYVPYAPIEKAIPYLIRRAEENTSIQGQVGRELSIRKKELHRRKKRK